METETAKAILEGVELLDVILYSLAGNSVLSELLPFSKGKSNGTLHLILNLIKSVVGVFAKKPK